MSRVLKERYNQITYGYKNRVHDGIDVVGKGYTLDSIVAHSDGQVVAVRRDYRTSDRTGNSYGNYVKIKHDNGYYTLYAHLKYGSVCVSVGDKVSRGQVIGYMGATGHVTGAHLHFEVRNENDVRIDPTNYIDSDLPQKEESKPQTSPKKSIEEIANEVIQGKWGNGEARKSMLKSAGYNYQEVQNKVNQILRSTNTTTSKKSVDEVAKEVIQGKYGNQPERQKKIEAEGYNYKEVQNKVNQIIKG